MGVGALWSFAFAAASYQIALTQVAPQLQSLWGRISSSVLSPVLALIAHLLQQFSCCTVCSTCLSYFLLVSVCASLLSWFWLLHLLSLACVLLWHLPSLSSCVCRLLAFTSHSYVFFCRGTRDSSGSILVHCGSDKSITEPIGTNCAWHRAVPDLFLHMSPCSSPPTPTSSC